MPLDDHALASLLDLLFDHTCARPVSDFIDADRVLAILDEVATVERITQVRARFVKPLSDRLLERALGSELLVATWLPEAQAARLTELSGKPARIPKKVIDEVIANEKVRDEVRTTLSETLTSFIRKASAPVSGPATSGLRGALGFGARAVASAGKGLLGGIGDELQRQLQDRVRDFVDASVEAIQERIARKLGSDETAAALGKRRRKWVAETLARTEKQVASQILASRIEELEAMVPALIAHNVKRAEVRAAITDETRAWVEEASKQSIGELLDEYGIKEHARAALHAHGLPFARALCATPSFSAWWAEHGKR